MRIKLYQIDHDLDQNRVTYCSYDSTIRYAGTVDPGIYVVVFDGEVDCKDIEDVYRLFNVGAKPDNYSGRSMSVSDVLRVVESDHVAPGFYFCDTIGFKKIDFDAEKIWDGGRCEIAGNSNKP